MRFHDWNQDVEIKNDMYNKIIYDCTHKTTIRNKTELPIRPATDMNSMLHNHI